MDSILFVKEESVKEKNERKQNEILENLVRRGWDGSYCEIIMNNIFLTKI